MIDRGMIMVCVLARLNAQGKLLDEVSQDELGTLIAEAIADLRLADDVVAANQ